MKKNDSFLICAENIDCVYTLESHQNTDCVYTLEPTRVPTIYVLEQNIKREEICILLLNLVLLYKSEMGWGIHYEGMLS